MPKKHTKPKTDLLASKTKPIVTPDPAKDPILPPPPVQCLHITLTLQDNAYKCIDCGGILKVTLPRLFIST